MNHPDLHKEKLTWKAYLGILDAPKLYQTVYVVSIILLTVLLLYMVLKEITGV